MKNIILIMLLSVFTVFGNVLALAVVPKPVFAVQLQGQIGETAGPSMPDGSLKWFSSYLDLSQIRTFTRGTRLRITLMGDANYVLVRLLPYGASPSSQIGIVGGRRIIPPGGVITIPLTSDYPDIIQVSVCSGREAFQMLLGHGLARITKVEVL